jgi:hypothetical protein
MKTRIIFFTDYKAIDACKLYLPKIMDIDELTHKHAWSPVGTVHLDTGTIYFDHWVGFVDDRYSDTSIMILPDFAKVNGAKHGFYLEQTSEMQLIRDETFQCGICKMQYKNPTAHFCIECLVNSDIPNDEFWRAFLRPVSTLDIDINHKSIYIPKDVLQYRERLPQLLESNGKIINV